MNYDQVMRPHAKPTPIFEKKNVVQEVKVFKNELKY